MAQETNPNGAIIYRGPSMLDGQPIVVVATGLQSRSANPKTGGGMIQTWILRDDATAPHEHVRAGTDASICGDCPFRSGNGCYVRVFQAPRGIWAAYRRDRYADRSGEIRTVGAGRKIRIGSYGDPMAVPAHVWERLTEQSIGWTGYTHQWRRAGSEAYSRFCMASCETTADVLSANERGYRTFRVSAGVDPMPGHEVLCPASKEAGFRTTCDACGLCQGNVSRARNVMIPAHGGTAKRAKTALLAIG